MAANSDKQATVQRSYGRGFHDGLRKAKEDMNAAKIERAERGISTAARKVLDCVPAKEVWSAHKIGAELIRVGHNFDKAQILGILGSLKDDGLIKEPEGGAFIRVTAAYEAGTAEPGSRVAAGSQKVVPLPSAAPSIEQPAQPKDTLQKLADMSFNLRKVGAELHEFAQSIDDLAIEVEERIAQVNAGNEKLKQLQALLRSIGSDA